MNYASVHYNFCNFAVKLSMSFIHKFMLWGTIFKQVLDFCVYSTNYFAFNSAMWCV